MSPAFTRRSYYLGRWGLEARMSERLDIKGHITVSTEFVIFHQAYNTIGVLITVLEFSFWKGSNLFIFSEGVQLSVASPNNDWQKRKKPFDRDPVLHIRWDGKLLVNNLLCMFVSITASPLMRHPIVFEVRFIFPHRRPLFWLPTRCRLWQWHTSRIAWHQVPMTSSQSLTKLDAGHGVLNPTTSAGFLNTGYLVIRQGLHLRFAGGPLIAAIRGGNSGVDSQILIEHMVLDVDFGSFEPLVGIHEKPYHNDEHGGTLNI